MLYINMETAVITTTKPTNPTPVHSMNTFFYFSGTSNLLGKSNSHPIYPFLPNTAVREIREDYDLLSLDDVMCHPFSFQPVVAIKNRSLFYGFCFFVYNSICKNVFGYKIN